MVLPAVAMRSGKHSYGLENCEQFCKGFHRPLLAVDIDCARCPDTPLRLICFVSMLLTIFRKEAGGPLRAARFAAGVA